GLDGEPASCIAKVPPPGAQVADEHQLEPCCVTCVTASNDKARLRERNRAHGQLLGSIGRRDRRSVIGLLLAVVMLVPLALVGMVAGFACLGLAGATGGILLLALAFLLAVAIGMRRAGLVRARSGASAGL